MNYVLDRNADVRQVCLILTISYRVINFQPFCYVTALPYDVKRFCFAGCVLRMWGDGTVWRRGIHHGLYRSVGSREFSKKAGNFGGNLITRFRKIDLEMGDGGRGGGVGNF